VEKIDYLLTIGGVGTTTHLLPGKERNHNNLDEGGKKGKRGGRIVIMGEKERTLFHTHEGGKERKFRNSFLLRGSLTPRAQVLNSMDPKKGNIQLLRCAKGLL